MDFFSNVLNYIIHFDYFNLFEIMFPIVSIIIAIVVLAGIFSSIETSLLVVSDAKLMRLKKQGNKNAKKLVEMKKNMTRTISSIIFISNAINIMGASLVTTVTIKTIGINYTAIVSIILTFVVIVFSKIIPKILGQYYSEPIALKTATLVLVISKITAPLSFLIEKISDLFTKNQNYNSFNEEDIKMQLQLAAKSGNFESDKMKHIESIFNLTEKKVFDVMTPSTQLEYVNAKDSIYDKNIKHYFQKSAHTRIVVVGKDINSIKGYVLKNQYLNILINTPQPNEDYDKNLIARLTKPIITVMDDISVNELLKKMQNDHQMIAIVKNKFGTTLGVVTMEDIIEQIIGQVVDETDKYSDLRKKGQEKFTTYLKNQEMKEEKSE